MAIKTVVCEICRESVHKRQTLSLRVLGDRRVGRACKVHEEVVALVHQNSSRASAFIEHRRERERQEEEDARFVHIEDGVTLVRAILSMKPGNPEVPYLALDSVGYTSKDVECVRERVEQRVGNPLDAMERDLVVQLTEHLKTEERTA